MLLAGSVMLALASAGTTSSALAMGYLVPLCFGAWALHHHRRLNGESRSREEKLRALIDDIPGVVFQLVSSTRNADELTLMSRGGWHLVEASADDGPLSFEHFMRFVVPEDIPGVERSIALAVQNKVPWAHEFRIRTARGKLKWLSGTAKQETVPADDGRFIFNGLMVDVTARVLAEAALDQVEHSRDLIIEAAGEGIFGIDREGRIEFINRAASSLLGWPVEDLIGKSQRVLYDRVHGRQLEASVLSGHAAAHPGDRHAAEAIFRRRDGSTFTADYVAIPLIEKGSLAGAIVMFRDLTESFRLTEELRHQATHDNLTGLFNRRNFEQHVAEVLAQAGETPAEHVLAYVDLDQFKVINDTCGHVAGDELLRQLAHLLEDQLRRSDMLARLGGDEFGILMQRCSMAQAQAVMQRVQFAVSNFRFAWEQKSFKPSLSIGLVPLNSETTDLCEVLRRADAACYAAKDAGRNRIHCYDHGDAEFVRRHGEMQWVSRIHQALEQDEFELYAQSIVRTDVTDGHYVHYEILLRLREADGAIIPPGAFLPAAERYNLSPLIDRWVITATLSWLAAHPASLARLNMCCINLSGLSLGDADTYDYIVRQFSETGIPPEKICFEITETAAIANLERATVFIHQLKALGCRFALDDFGSGLSSFAYLKNLPVDYLKIDGMFVKDIMDDAMDLAIVRSINEVGHAMGMRTIGEFVENDAVLRRLADIGVDYAQGYGIGRPCPLEELLHTVATVPQAPTILRTSGARDEVSRQVA